MKTLSELQHFFESGHLDYLPNLTIDCAIFGYHEKQLKLLLVKNKIVTDCARRAVLQKRGESF